VGRIGLTGITLCILLGPCPRLMAAAGYPRQPFKQDPAVCLSIHLGPIGAVAKLEKEHPRQLTLWGVHPGGPAADVLEPGDVVVGVNGRRFDEFVWENKRHARWWYGYDGPLEAIGSEIEESEGDPGLNGRLTLDIVRQGQGQTVVVKLEPVGYHSGDWPYDCPKSDRIIERAADLLKAQGTRNAHVGLALLAAYFVGLPLLLARTAMKRLRAELGRWRYWLMTLLLLAMISLPLKMLLRWTFHLSYVVSIPEWSLNF